MTKLGVQGGPDEEVKQDVGKDPKVFTVVQPTFVPIPVQTTEPMRKSVPSTWCLMARLLAIVLVGSLLFSLLVFAVWNKDEVARAITGEKSTIRTLSEPQFAALNSQVHAGEVEKKEEPKDDGAQITIKQTGEGTQMIIQMPKSDETKDGAKTAEDTPAIPVLALVPARERSEEGSEQQDDSQEMEAHRRPMHPYEMEGPSPDALNFGMMHPMMALQAARAAQYENEMRAWRMRRLQQMLVLAAVQQAQQREAAMRYAFFQRQQWAAQQMAMQQAMEARRQAEWQEYWRRAAIARMMQQQAAMQQMQQQQQPVASSWQAAEQPRPWFTQQQQPMMQWPQQQFVQQPQWQAQQQQQPMMMPQQPPFWMQQQQQQQPQFEQQGGPQVPQSQPLFLFQQALQARLRERLQLQHMQQLRQEAAQHDMQQHQMMQQHEMQPQMQQQSDEESQEQAQPQPQPQPHAFIFIRRFFPIPQDSREQQPPQPAGSSSSSSSSEESNEKNIPLRPHDASAQQIVEQMRGGPNSLPDAPLPGIHDRIFQHFQTLSQQMQDRSGQSQAQSQPPLFASIPNSVEQQTDSASQQQSQESRNYDQDAIYEKLQRQSMQLQHDGPAVSVQTDSASTSASHSKEDIKTTTEPVMIENFVRAQSQEKNDEDELTPEEKRKVAQLDSAELKEAAALEASLEREANEQNDAKKEAALVKVEEEIVHDANKDSSSVEDKSESSDEKKESEEKDEEPTPAATTLDPLSEFFRFFEKEAVKLSAQDKQAERVVVDSETGTRQTPVVDELNDEENSTEHETKPDEMPEELPSTDSSKDSEEVAASIDTAPVSNEAEIKVSQVATSREIPPITIAAAA